MSRSAEALTGHLAEYQELLELLAERPGLLVIAADPWSGASDLLSTATESLDGTYVSCDARPCADALDLAMAVADAAVATLAADATAWWMGSAPPASTAGLRLSRTLSSAGIDLHDLQHGTGKGLRRLSDAIELAVALDPDAALVIDHLGLMLSAMSPDEARQVLAELRAASQRHPRLDLVLVEHSDGVMSNALRDPDHPMFQAGQSMRIRRSPPSRFVGDLAVTRAWTAVPAGMLGAAAELAAGVPALTWRVVELANEEAEEETEALSGWRRLQRVTRASTERQWDMLRRIHSQAQPVVAAMGVGLRPHSVAANSKSIYDALNRLRGLGVAWQPEERHWSLSDPLLSSWVRENAPSWGLRRSQGG
ncbi:MAG TPA: hypothetical protein VMR96_02670 [Solirubrobacterales bacterium]|nr:hypothetical protein [Solirubrobacterales bacterium]